MANEFDDLDALFETEAAQYQPPASIEPTPSTPAVADAGTVADDLDRYYQAVSGLYVRETAPPAIGTGTSSDASTDAFDASLYERLGGIVRQLHDSLRELGLDQSLSEANTQIGEAKDRLEHIAALTEQSAVKVLNTLEAGMPAQDELVKKGREMEERWEKLFAGKIGIEEFKLLAADSRQFAAGVVAEGEKEKARLLEIMMAQDFQDLTGQIIKKVVGVTKSIEQDLAKLLLDNAPAQVKEKHVELMSGPAVPGKALEQDDVDNMLADLGF